MTRDWDAMNASAPAADAERTYAEPAWYAPARNLAPAALVVAMLLLVTGVVLLPHGITQSARWSTWQWLILAVFYAGMTALALYIMSLVRRIDQAGQRHIDDVKRLSAANERLDTALNLIREGVMLLDVDGRVKLMNEQAELLTGWPAGEAVGRALKEIFVLQDREKSQMLNDPRLTVKCEDPTLPSRHENEGMLAARDGTIHRVAYEAAPNLDTEGWLAGTILSFRDVTALREAEQQRETLIQELSEINQQLEEEIGKREQARRAALNLLQDAQEAQSALREREEQLRILYEGIDDALLVYETDGRIIYCNQAACAALNYNRQDLLEKRIGEVLVQHDEAGAPPCIRTRGGQSVPVDVHTSAIHYQGHEATMAVTRDITPLKKVQDMLRERNERLLESNAALEEYARVASHDLQEPLRKIENFCEILQEDYADALDEEGQQYLRILVRSAGRMRKLIKDVLAFSRAGSEERPLEEVDLGEVLSSVCENLSARIEDKHAEIVYDTLPTVRADRTQMLQLFQNLISNALKFNEQDVPRVVIQSRALAQEWVITVSDNGIGMKEWELRYIFVPFKRLHNRNKYDGTGIGLAVCRRNIHRHGGTINVASEPGKGSVFTITLPRPAPGTPLSHETDKTEEVTS